MQIRRNSQSIHIQTPAKVNLFLDVLGKRDDGFHELQTLLCPISLFDTLIVQAAPEPTITLELTLPPAANAGNVPAWDIPADERNLVIRAVRQLQQKLGIQGGCRIQLQKAIPAAAGLGGGSSDAAAAIVGSLAVWGCWDRGVAMEVAASLGSDIPFFLGDRHGIGLAIGTGRGEKCQQLTCRPAIDMLVTHPDVGCPTARVYELYQTSRGQAPKTSPGDFGKIVHACEDGQLQKIGAGMFNALQFASSHFTDWIDKQLRFLNDCGCNHGLMSGSGSSCFGLLESPQSEQRARAMLPHVGLSRLYSVRAWYGSSIEQQLGLTQL